MIDSKALNPENEHQARVLYDSLSADLRHHPQQVMATLASELGFKILSALPQPIFDRWVFWIEFEAPPDLPEFIRPSRWKALGEP